MVASREEQGHGSEQHPAAEARGLWWSRRTEEAAAQPGRAPHGAAGEGAGVGAEAMAAAAPG